jgi:hypothetical protein
LRIALRLSSAFCAQHGAGLQDFETQSDGVDCPCVAVRGLGDGIERAKAATDLIGFDIV